MIIHNESVSVNETKELVIWGLPAINTLFLAWSLNLTSLLETSGGISAWVTSLFLSIIGVILALGNSAKPYKTIAFFYICSLLIISLSVFEVTKASETLSPVMLIMCTAMIVYILRKL